jgi:hypothetical protein
MQKQHNDSSEENKLATRAAMIANEGHHGEVSTRAESSRGLAK